MNLVAHRSSCQSTRNKSAERWFRALPVRLACADGPSCVHYCSGVNILLTKPSRRGFLQASNVVLIGVVLHQTRVRHFICLIQMFWRETIFCRFTNIADLPPRTLLYEICSFQHGVGTGISRTVISRQRLISPYRRIYYQIPPGWIWPWPAAQ